VGGDDLRVGGDLDGSTVSVPVAKPFTPVCWSPTPTAT
jgi:hypothetical protein